MTRLFSIFLLCLYILSISGIAISGHFCGDKLRAIHIMKNGADFHAKHCCKTDKMDGGCCEDKHAKLDVKKHFSAADKLVKFQPSFKEYLQPELYIIFRVQSPTESISASCNAPPAESPPIYLLNRVFRI